MTMRTTTATLSFAVYTLLLNLHAISQPAKFSQEPNYSALHSVVVPADETATLQSLCDRGGIVDLGGRQWTIHKIMLSSRHNGLRIRNGILFSPSDKDRPDKRFGIIEIRNPAASPLNLTLDDIEFVGPLSRYTDDFLVNAQTCRETGAYCSAVLAIDQSRIDSLTIRNCTARTMFGGFTLGYTVNAKVYDCRFDRIATQCVSALTGDEQVQRVVDLYRCHADTCGSLFDFSGYSPNVAAPKVPIAKVRQSSGTNLLGRTKCHAQWIALIDRCNFVINRPMPQRYAAISFPAAHTVNISNCLTSGFVTGIQSTDWVEKPFIDIRNTTIRGAQIGVNASATYHLSSVVFDNCLYPFGLPPASQIDTQVINPASDESTARKILGLQAIVRNWNQLHGTTYDPDRYFWISNEVKARMAQMQLEVE